MFAWRYLGPKLPFIGIGRLPRRWRSHWKCRNLPLPEARVKRSKGTQLFSKAPGPLMGGCERAGTDWHREGFRRLS